MFQHLLVPIDDSELAPKAMSASIELAGRLGASVTGLVVEPAVAPSSTGRSAAHYLDEIADEARQVEGHARELMRVFELKARRADVPFNAHYVRTEMTDRAILEIAYRLGCDLIVMVTHGRRGLDRLLHGSHAQAVLARTDLPLLVLPATGMATQRGKTR
jgi:nucleotide-binding universal stress UspA family protein